MVTYVSNDSKVTSLIVRGSHPFSLSCDASYLIFKLWLNRWNKKTSYIGHYFLGTFQSACLLDRQFCGISSEYQKCHFRRYGQLFMYSPKYRGESHRLAAYSKRYILFWFKCECDGENGESFAIGIWHELNIHTIFP